MMGIHDGHAIWRPDRCSPHPPTRHGPVRPLVAKRMVGVHKINSLGRGWTPGPVSTLPGLSIGTQIGLQRPR
jgi:hypothetical protein